jgi:SCP-2 sterol transfer family
MPVFPSRAWAEQAMALVNADPEAVAAGRDWKGDFGIVIESEPGRLAEPFVAWVRPENGQIAELRVLVDPDDLDELAPTYRIAAPFSVWKALLQGTLDSVQALAKRRLRVEGDVEPLVKRMRYKDIATRTLAGIETRFADE